MSRKKKAKIEEGPWNKDKAVGQMAPFTPAQAGVIRSLLTAEKKIRDLALFNTALDTMLRASDLLPLRVIDITDHNGDVVQEFNIKQKKTGRHLTREQYANLVKRWSSFARLDPKRHSTHSMRRSKSAADLRRHAESRRLPAPARAQEHRQHGALPGSRSAQGA